MCLFNKHTFSSIMKKTGIFYASATGTTADIARRIAKALGVADADIHDVADTAPDRFGEYDTIIIGSSTYGSGDLEDDMADFLDGASALALKGMKIAVFGCGDETMSDTFCNAVGTIYKRLEGTGATMIGEFPPTGYTFEASSAADGATMVGLVIDEVNHPELTDKRIAQWLEQISKE